MRNTVVISKDVTHRDEAKTGRRRRKVRGRKGAVKMTEINCVGNGGVRSVTCRLSLKASESDPAGCCNTVLQNLKINYLF